MGRMRCYRFFSSFIYFISNDKRIIGDIFDNLLLFFPFLFEFLSFIIRFFIHDSFEELSILNLNIFKLFVSKTLIEAFIHFLFLWIYWVDSAGSLSFERGLFGHNGVDFLKEHSILSLNLSKTILLKHFFLFILISSFKGEL